MVSSLFVNYLGSSKSMVSGLIQELKSIIMDAKGESGIIGLTQKKPALVHRTLTHHLLGAYSATIRNHSGMLAKEYTVHGQDKPAGHEDG